MPKVFDVDPCELHVPTSMRTGADPYKLQRQTAKFGSSADGMPPIWVYEGSNGELVIFNGVTRATRIAKLAPGKLVPVEIIGDYPGPCALLPKIGDMLP